MHALKGRVHSPFVTYIGAIGQLVKYKRRAVVKAPASVIGGVLYS